MRDGSYGDLLVGASSGEAQLILSLLVWPHAAPDPRLVDEWVRVRAALRAEANDGSTLGSHMPRP